MELPANLSQSVARLQSAQPDLDAFVGKRHYQLRYLFRRAKGIREQVVVPRPVGQPKIGRKDASDPRGRPNEPE
ncbi:MAG: hypothetical protein HYY23_09565 [Verrucomicrobia bacterium]|nr:hypothetical protein [Verrucomicrobiota bacterium]